jgi:hypothetical protein
MRAGDNTRLDGSVLNNVPGLSLLIQPYMAKHHGNARTAPDGPRILTCKLRCLEFASSPDGHQQTRVSFCFYR